MAKQNHGEQQSADELQQLLEALEADPTCLEALLARHPRAERYKGELLLASYLLEERELCDPRPGYIGASRRRLVATLKAAQAAHPPQPARRQQRFGALLRLRPIFQLALLAVVALLVFIGSLWVADTAQAALPGAPLYAFKLVLEDVQFAVTADLTDQAILLLNYAGKRLDELRRVPAATPLYHIEATLVRYESNVQRAITLMEVALAEEDGPENQTLHAVIARLPDLLAADQAAIAALQELPAMQLAAQMGLFDESRAFLAVNSERAASLNVRLTTLVSPPPAGLPAVVPGLRQTGEPALLSTQTSTSTPGAPALTGSPAPSGTPTSTGPPSVTVTAPPGATATPQAGRESKPSPTPKPTKEDKELPTPRPTNENRPTPRPTNENRPSGEDLPAAAPTKKK